MKGVPARPAPGGKTGRTQKQRATKEHHTQNDVLRLERGVLGILQSRTALSSPMCLHAVLGVLVERGWGESHTVRV